MIQPKQITTSVPPAWCGNEYSSMSPWNCDNSRLLVIHQDHFAIHLGDGGFLLDLPIPADAEPRWSRTDPKTFYFINSGNALMIRTDGVGVRLLHLFPEYNKITGKGESDISVDGRHLVLCGTRLDGIEEIFAFDVLLLTKGPVFPQSEPFDGLKITASNMLVLSKASGLYIFGVEKDGTIVLGRKITNVNGHACPCRYQGKEYMLFCASNDPQINANAVALVDVQTGIVDILATFAWALSFHISAPVGLDWCLVSTDCPNKSLTPQCYKVFYDKRPPELICDTNSVYVGYNSQLKAALSWDGSRFVFCSNSGIVADPNYCDTWMGILANVPPPIPTRTRIDYSTYVGKSRFIMEPRADGAVDIYEEDV